MALGDNLCKVQTYRPRASKLSSVQNVKRSRRASSLSRWIGGIRISLVVLSMVCFGWYWRIACEWVVGFSTL